MKTKPIYDQGPVVLDLPNAYGATKDVFINWDAVKAKTLDPSAPNGGQAPVVTDNGLLTPRNLLIGAAVLVGGFLIYKKVRKK